MKRAEALPCQQSTVANGPPPPASRPSVIGMFSDGHVRLRAIARLGDEAAAGGSDDDSADEYKPELEVGISW